MFDRQPDPEELMRADGIYAEPFTLQAMAHLGDGSRDGLGEDDRTEGGARSAR